MTFSDEKEDFKELVELATGFNLRNATWLNLNQAFPRIYVAIKMTKILLLANSKDFLEFTVG